MSVVIHLGGELPSRQLAHEVAHGASLLIAADKGYDSAVRNGLAPQYVTGDLDSIESVPSSVDIKVIPAKEQNATDFEKALRLVPSDTQELHILGGTGLRSDHFLTNLLIATEQPLSRSVVFHDDLQTIHRVTPQCDFKATLPVGTIVSLIPFSDCSGTTTTGLFWNLESAEMGPSKQFGQSNEVSKEDVSIQIAKGRLFVVVNQLQGVKE